MLGLVLIVPAHSSLTLSNTISEHRTSKKCLKDMDTSKLVITITLFQKILIHDLCFCYGMPLKVEFSGSSSSRYSTRVEIQHEET